MYTNTLKIVAATIAVSFLLVGLADAKPRHYHKAKYHRVLKKAPVGDFGCAWDNDGKQTCHGFSQATTESYRTRSRTRVASYGDSSIVEHPAGCPRTSFCGCGVSVKVFGKPIRNLFLASNWFKFPHASPGPGMVAVRNHHVMYIMAMDANGNATVYDPNSGGHKTRIHTRSLAGYSVRNPNGQRMASN